MSTLRGLDGGSSVFGARPKKPYPAPTHSYSQAHGSKKPPVKLRTQQITAALFVGGGLACLTSILLLMRSLDPGAAPAEILDGPELDAETDHDSLSIRALHLLHQAKVRATQASQLEVCCSPSWP